MTARADDPDLQDTLTTDQLVAVVPLDVLRREVALAVRQTRDHDGKPRLDRAAFRLERALRSLGLIYEAGDVHA